jgi:hypothetical protein
MAQLREAGAKVQARTPERSSLLAKLRALGDTAFWDAESVIETREVFAGVALAIVLIMLLIPLLGYLYNAVPVWLFMLLFFSSVAAVIFASWSCGRYFGGIHWQRFNSEYERVAAALRTTDLALIVADADLRVSAYSRMQIALPPKWLTGVSEPLECHVQRAAQHFETLLNYADPQRSSGYWNWRAYEQVPKRIALIALTDFFLGCDSRVLRGRVAAPDPKDNFSELSDLLLRIKPGLTDIGGQVRMRRQQSEQG